MKKLTQIVEAIVFAAGSPIAREEILAKLPEKVSRKELNAAINELEARYSGESGIVLEIFDENLQFASNSAYGEIVAEVLQPVKEKELTKILLEVLAIIAYQQPITRGEIEDIRGVSADYAINVLTRVNLIRACGIKQAPGKPVLYGTTDEFLKRFGLRSLDEMPDYGEVMRRLIEYGNFNAQTEGLYREVDLADDFDEPTASQLQQEAELEQFLGGEDAMPFQSGEQVMTFEADDEVAAVAADADEDDEGDEEFDDAEETEDEEESDGEFIEV